VINEFEGAWKEAVMSNLKYYLGIFLEGLSGRVSVISPETQTDQVLLRRIVFDARLDHVDKMASALDAL
jgi:hypothetical protein